MPSAIKDLDQVSQSIDLTIVPDRENLVLFSKWFESIYHTLRRNAKAICSTDTIIAQMDLRNDIVEDAISDLIMDIFLTPQIIRDKQNVSGFLYTCLLNRLRSFKRSKKQRQCLAIMHHDEASQSGILDEGWEVVGNFEVSPTITEDVFIKIDAFIDNSPKNIQTLYRLRHIDGHDFKTISKLLGVTEVALRQQSSRLKKLLINQCKAKQSPLS